MRHLKNERGSALIIALLMVVLLSVIGLMSVRTSSVETRIAANDKLQKNAFHQAEGGLHVAKELIEEVIVNLGWTDGHVEKNVKVIKGAFDSNVRMDTGTPMATDAAADVTFPVLNSDGTAVTSSSPHTNLMFGSSAQLATGSGIQMSAGYEGLAKSAAQGGSWKIYDIRSQYQDGNSMARVKAQWLHVNVVTNQ